MHPPKTAGKKGSIRYEYPHPAVTTDLCIFTLGEAETLSVALIKRKLEPFRDCWSLPGGFLRAGEETLEDCARRELLEETGLSNIQLELVKPYSRPDRDPRPPEHQVITIAYMALVPYDQNELKAGSDAAEVCWVPVDRATSLAFDHDEILADSAEMLRSQL